MTSSRSSARIAGLLFIVATVADLASTALLNPIFDKADYLTSVSMNEYRVAAGASLALVAAFACATIAISMFRVLRKYHEGLALGSVGLRLIEGTLYAVGVVAVFLTLSLSRDFITDGSTHHAYFHILGKLLAATRNETSLVASVAFYVGASMYYAIFYRAKLVPRWLSGWGLIGTSLGFVGAMLVCFQVTAFMSSLDVTMNVPIALNEMVLAVWLIVKGFAMDDVDAIGVTMAQPSTTLSVPVNR